MEVSKSGYEILGTWKWKYKFNLIELWIRLCDNKWDRCHGINGKQEHGFFTG